jgi:hypothetical protein
LKKNDAPFDAIATEAFQFGKILHFNHNTVHPFFGCTDGVAESHHPDRLTLASCQGEMSFLLSAPNPAWNHAGLKKNRVGTGFPQHACGFHDGLIRTRGTG